LGEYANANVMVVESKKALIRKLNNDVEFLPHKLNIDLAEFQDYQINKPTFQKLIIESEIKDRTSKLLEDQNDYLRIQLQERNREIERLNQLLSQREKNEDGY
jgi:hypothetical protein